MAYPGNFLTVIYTVDRTENYLAQTIADLKVAGVSSAAISQGSISAKNINEANIDSAYFSVQYPPQVISDENFESRGLGYRAQVNFINALRVCPANYSYRLILEDDVHASKHNTLPVLSFYLSKTEAIEKDRPFILSLYTPYISKQDHIDVKKIDVDGFFGLQACLFSESICSSFAIFIEERIATKPHDFLIKDFCKENQINLYGATHSLFQHTGVKTTGLGHHHTAENFIGDEKIQL